MRHPEVTHPYVTRFGEKIYWKSMPVSHQRCIERAVAYYNRKPSHLAFIDWMLEQPEIMHYFTIAKGIRLTRAGKRSALYAICTDLLFRITRSEGITGKTQNTPLQ